MLLTKSHGQVQNGRHEVAQSQRAIPSHVPQDEDRDDVRAQLEADVVESVPQPFCPQNP